MANDKTGRALLDRFIAGTTEAMVKLGWEVDPAWLPDASSMFLGTFRRSVAADDWLATVEFAVESGPTIYGLELRLTGVRKTDRFEAVVGGEIGVRHLPTERLLRALDARCEATITRDLEDIFASYGDELPTMTDAQSVDHASQKLVAAADAYAMPFAREHADVDAVIAFITNGELTNRDPESGYMLVPALLAASGREAEARAALAAYRRRPQSGPSDEEDYARFAAQLSSWLDNPPAWRSRALSSDPSPSTGSSGAKGVRQRAAPKLARPRRSEARELRSVDAANSPTPGVIGTRPSSEVSAALVGDPVLWVISDTQSGALLDLGAQRPLARRIPNSALTHEQREFEGEHSLLIRCHWELRFPTGLQDFASASEATRSLELLDRLAGLSIEAATIDESKLDLALTFDNGVLLRVDPTARPSRLVGGYTIRIDRFFWSVSDKGQVAEKHH